MIDLSKYRVIDLSQEILPGELKLDGRYLHGEPRAGRPVELREFIAYGARMHFLQGQTHTGTHAEATYKYSESGPDVGSMPIESYLGEAAACNFTQKEAAEPISAGDLREQGVRTGDIVLCWARPDTANHPPYLTIEAVDWLIETRIKALCIEHLQYSPPGTPLGQDDADCKLLLAGIPMIDAPNGLDQIKKPRVFFIALPVKLRRATASWTRAIALEPQD